VEWTGKEKYAAAAWFVVHLCKPLKVVHSCSLSTMASESSSLLDYLESIDCHAFSHARLLEFLCDDKLANLVEAVTKNKWSGTNFMMKLDHLKLEFGSELKYLEEREHTRAESPGNMVPVRVQRSFSTNTAIDEQSGHFYIDRAFAVKLAKSIASNPGAYLVHGPRSSGKSTVLGQLLNYLGMKKKLVYASVDVLGFYLAPNIEEFMKRFASEIARENSRASPEVRAVANSFLSNPGTAANALQYLFDASYDGKKLVLILDEFDACYAQAYSANLASSLRFVKNQIKFGGSQSYQAILCFGAYNASRLYSETSPFIEDTVYTNSHLDFSVTEVELLFGQYCEEYGVTIEVPVFQRIHTFTGGHTGMVNSCGRLLQDTRLENVTLEQWVSLEANAVEMYAMRKIFKNIISCCEVSPYEAKVKSLLARLCHGNGIFPREYDVYTEYVLNLGLAALETRPGIDSGDSERTSIDSSSHQQSSSVFKLSSLATALPEEHWLVIKSEMIRRCAINYILHEVDVFTGSIPMSGPLLDIVAFLMGILRHFNQDVIGASYGYSYKKHEITRQAVPSEAVYQHQFSAVLLKAFFRHKLWRCSYESNSDNKKLDLFIRGPDNLKVGIELTASVKAASLAEHARRSYPKTLELDQYVVVNLTSVRTDSEFGTHSCPGIDKHGNHVEVPVIHVLHNEAFTSVELFTGPESHTRII
jgi:hypothetical protein